MCTSRISDGSPRASSYPEANLSRKQTAIRGPIRAGNIWRAPGISAQWWLSGRAVEPSPQIERVEWFLGHVVKASPEMVRVKWHNEDCEYVKDFSRQSKHIRPPDGESFKAAASFQGSYAGWKFCKFELDEKSTGYYRRGTLPMTDAERETCPAPRQIAGNANGCVMAAEEVDNSHRRILSP